MKKYEFKNNKKKISIFIEFFTWLIQSNVSPLNMKLSFENQTFPWDRHSQSFNTLYSKKKRKKK